MQYCHTFQNVRECNRDLSSEYPLQVGHFQCFCAILSVFGLFWSFFGKSDRFARKILSPKLSQFWSTNIWIGSHLQVVWDSIYHFLISLKSTDSIFQKTTVYCITRQRYRVGMDKMVHKHSKSLIFRCTILFEVIWCHHGPKRPRAEHFVATVAEA